MSSLHRLAPHLLLLMSIFVVSACSSDSSSEPTSSSDSDIAMDSGSGSDSSSTDGSDGETPAADANLSLSDELQGLGDESLSIVGGVLNQQTAEPVTPESHFQIASIGKTFVATMFLRFADMGMVQLDDPIDRWLEPEMSAMVNNSDTITVEMLLAHTSGIPDYVNGDTGYVADFLESRGRVWTATEALSYIDTLDNFFEPGEEFRYSNTNFLLLGVIAERVTEGPLGLALRQWVFEPAGLRSTYGGLEDVGQSDVAHGYMPASIIAESGLDLQLPEDGSALDTFDFIRLYGFGDAPVQSTPADLNQFIRTLVDTDDLVSGELKSRMLSESFPDSSQYGLGIVVLRRPTAFGHSGRFFGLQSAMFYIPRFDLSFAITANASNGLFGPLYSDLEGQVFETLEARIP